MTVYFSVGKYLSSCFNSVPSFIVRWDKAMPSIWPDEGRKLTLHPRCRGEKTYPPVLYAGEEKPYLSSFQGLSQALKLAW